jgi:hypothetical protein
MAYLLTPEGIDDFLLAECSVFPALLLPGEVFVHGGVDSGPSSRGFPKCRVWRVGYDRSRERYSAHAASSDGGASCLNACCWHMA